eukprot:TRINITY_DN24_c0_g1_i1.p1 TRINITY_DN24_c0_g1~~TRINITY_DN24_c0_g1_i1.p1  ORF type:complete len:235 (-),score=53.50 TRINITY_DN24_c0_g1_i1:593-1249(-)
MPRSKRAKLVSLTQTVKRGRPGKESLIEEVRELLQQYQYVYVFVPVNMRNNSLANLRQRYKRKGRFMFGKNKVMQVALGRTPDDEVLPNIHKLSQQISGHCGLLFTNEEREVTEKYFATLEEADYPKSGFIATKTVEIPEGPLPQFAHSIEPYLRQLGMPTRLLNGVIHLVADYTICNEGEPLNPEQARLLKYFLEPMAVFKVVLTCVWSDDVFELLK